MLPTSSSLVGGALRKLRFLKPRLELFVALAFVFTKLVYIFFFSLLKGTSLFAVSFEQIFDY